MIKIGICSTRSFQFMLFRMHLSTRFWMYIILDFFFSIYFPCEILTPSLWQHSAPVNHDINKFEFTL